MRVSSLRTVCFGPLFGARFFGLITCASTGRRGPVSNVFCGFIDAGYLRAQGSRACGIPGGQAQLRASACVGWLQDVLPSQAVGVAGLRFLRTYWYDGALEPQHAGSPEQRRVFDGIAFTPGVQLRLGHLA